MRTRPLLALVAALTPIVVGVGAPPAFANGAIDKLRELIDDTNVCVGSPPVVEVDEICTGKVLRELADVVDPAPAYSEYVVVLKPPKDVAVDPTSASITETLDMLQSQASSNPDIAANRAEQAGASIHFVYRNALRGYAAFMSPATYASVAADPSVDYIEEVVWGEIVVDQPNPTWGLDRIDERYLPLDQNYHYHATGAGVKAYIVDTGIEYTHTEFAGRAVPGFDAVNPADGAVDCHGHGTHVAGTVGGLTYGVAKSTQLVGVRVLDCGGYGSTAMYAAGLDWMVQDHLPGQPAVANVSLHYFSVNQVVDDATENAIVDGIAFAVAAANDSADACDDSPSNVPWAMTVGATNSADAKAGFSNWGDCVDWFAPGVGITSAWIGGGTTTISGTSMASPHTAGVAAQVLQADPTLNPIQVRNAIYAMTTKNIVTSSLTTNNHLLFTEVLVHLAAGGTIEVSRDGSGYAWNTTGAFATDFLCSLWTVGTVRVECTPKPSNTVVWHCNYFVLTAWAPKDYPQPGTGQVKGMVSCDGPDTLWTTDVNGNGTATSNSAGLDMGTAGFVVCRAAGIGNNALPTGSYKVLCNEPGVEKPLAPGGYENAAS